MLNAEFKRMLVARKLFTYSKGRVIWVLRKKSADRVLLCVCFRNVVVLLWVRLGRAILLISHVDIFLQTLLL